MDGARDEVLDPSTLKVNPRTCSEVGCERNHMARGFCAKHYSDLWRKNQIETVKPTKPIHSLSDIDEAARTANCSVCGTVNKIRRRARGKGWECSTKVREHRRSLAGRNGARRRWVRSNYKITRAEELRMLAERNHRCDICECAWSESPGGLVVDHCHATGRVRGILCRGCNIGIGWFGDDPLRLTRAAVYVRSN